MERHGRPPLLAAALLGAFSGSLVSYGIISLHYRGPYLLRHYAEVKRRLQPDRIILVRHGQSEGNVNQALFKTKGDNLMELTERGSRQSQAVGRRLKRLIGDELVHFYVSPFQRTLQTVRNIIFTAFDPAQIVDVSVDPRIREQEFGNLQGDNFGDLREESKKVRRFWYRFPTGESGADVYDRTKQWWDSSMTRHVHEQTGARTIVVVTHGLTMRLILMQLFHWSPNTFHTVWNPDNCAMFVLRKNLSKPGQWPYELDKNEGDEIESSIDLVVTFENRTKRTLTLFDYLSIPPPRTLQLELVKQLLEHQHGLNGSSIINIDFFGEKFSFLGR